MARMIEKGSMFENLEYAFVIARVIAKAWLRWSLAWVDECNSS